MLSAVLVPHAGTRGITPWILNEINRGVFWHLLI